jgi:hypothetical protein
VFQDVVRDQRLVDALVAIGLEVNQLLLGEEFALLAVICVLGTYASALRAGCFGGQERSQRGDCEPRTALGAGMKRVSTQEGFKDIMHKTRNQMNKIITALNDGREVGLNEEKDERWWFWGPGTEQEKRRYLPALYWRLTFAPAPDLQVLKTNAQQHAADTSTPPR